MDKKTALEVAARIWCDPAYQHVTMDVAACDDIADILLRVANGTIRSVITRPLGYILNRGPYSER